MRQYVLGFVFILVLVVFGYYYTSNDLGGNDHFDKAGENWKRK